MADWTDDEIEATCEALRSDLDRVRRERDALREDLKTCESVNLAQRDAILELQKGLGIEVTKVVRLRQELRRSGGDF